MEVKKYINNREAAAIFGKLLKCEHSADKMARILNEEIAKAIEKEKENKAKERRNKKQQERKITKSGVTYSEPLFHHLIKSGYMNENAPLETWNYACALTTEEPKEKIVWQGTQVELFSLVVEFFQKDNYFSGKKITMKIICDLFVKRNGECYKPENIKNTYSQVNKDYSGVLSADKWNEMTKELG